MKITNSGTYHLTEDVLGNLEIEADEFVEIIGHGHKIHGWVHAISNKIALRNLHVYTLTPIEDKDGKCGICGIPTEVDGYSSVKVCFHKEGEITHTGLRKNIAVKISVKDADCIINFSLCKIDNNFKPDYICNVYREQNSNITNNVFYGKQVHEPPESEYVLRI